MEEFSTELIIDKLTYSKWVYFLTAGLVMGAYAYASPYSTGIKIVLSCLAVLLIIIAFLLSRNKIVITLIGNELVIKKYVLGKLIIESINTSEIEELTYRSNVKSNVFVSKGEIKVFGMDATPDSWNEYYYHPEVISFIYGNKRYELGKWRKPFNAKELYQKIKDNKLVYG